MISTFLIISLPLFLHTLVLHKKLLNISEYFPRNGNNSIILSFQLAYVKTHCHFEKISFSVKFNSVQPLKKKKNLVPLKIRF